MNVVKSFNELLEKSKKVEDASKNIKILIKILNGIDKKELFNLNFNSKNKYINKFRKEIKEILLHSNVNFKLLQKIKNKIIKKAQKDVFKEKSYYDLFEPFLLVDEKTKENLNNIVSFFSEKLNLKFRYQLQYKGWWIESECGDIVLYLSIKYDFATFGICGFGKKVCIERGFSVNFNQNELQKIINEFENIK